MTMPRTLQLALAITLVTLVVPAGVSSVASSATTSDATVSLLDRPATFGDALPPAVAKGVDPQEVDLASVRLGASRGTEQFYVAKGTRGLCLIRVDDPAAPAYVYTCASTLAAGGVYLAHLDRDSDTMELADIVPDDVTSASIDGKPVAVDNGLLVADDVPIGASVSLVGSRGAQSVPVPVAASPLPTAAAGGPSS
jgi:hypothetical protein